MLICGVDVTYPTYHTYQSSDVWRNDIPILWYKTKRIVGIPGTVWNWWEKAFNEYKTCFVECKCFLRYFLCSRFHSLNNVEYLPFLAETEENFRFIIKIETQIIMYLINMLIMSYWIFWWNTDEYLKIDDKNYKRNCKIGLKESSDKAEKELDKGISLLVVKRISIIHCKSFKWLVI